MTEDAQASTTTDVALTGTLVGADVDVETMTYGISGVTPVAGVATQVWAYGTLTVNTTTGAYAFAKNAAAVEALDATETVSNNFTMTVTDGDGALVTQTYTVLVNGADDAPTLGAVTSGSVRGAQRHDHGREPVLERSRGGRGSGDAHVRDGGGTWAAGNRDAGWDTARLRKPRPARTRSRRIRAMEQCSGEDASDVFTVTVTMGTARCDAHLR